MLLELKKSRSMVEGGKGSSANVRMRSRRRVVLLLLGLAAAVLAVVLLHKLREGRVRGVLLRERDRQVVTLQLVLQREKEKSREMKRKLEDKRAKIFVLKNQKMELANKLSESKEMVDHLQTKQYETEAALSEKQNQISMLSEKTTTTSLQVTDLTGLVKQKEAEVEELKQRLVKLTPKGNNPTAQEETKEGVSNANEGAQHEGTPAEGKWVNSQTNADDEGSKAQGEVSQDQQNKPPTNSQENENSEEGHEMDQVNTSETKEQSEVPKEVEEKEKEDARDGELQASDGKTSEKLEKIDSSQDGNEKRVVPEEKKMAGEGETRHGRRHKKRTKRRRRSNSRGWDLERWKSDGDLGKAQKDENLSENQDNGRNILVEGDDGLKRESRIDSEGNTEAGEGKQDDTNQQIPDTQNQENQGDDSKQDESVSNATVPDDTPVDEGLETEEQTNSEGEPEVTTEERLDDGNLQVSNTDNQEGAGSVEDNEGDGGKQNETDSNSTVPDDSNQQLPNTRNQEGAGSVKGSGGDDVNRITEEEGRKVTSAEGKPVESEKLDNDADDNSSDEKDKESGAEMQVEVMKEEEGAKTTSNIEQAEVQNDGYNHQSQISENTIDTELKEVTDDGEYQNEEDTT